MNEITREDAEKAFATIHFPSPEKCDSRERMIKSLERLEGYLYDKTKELRSEANWLGKMQVRVIKVLEKIDEDGEDHDGSTKK